MTENEKVFAAGTRVRNYGDQYGEAIQHGTATVIDHLFRGGEIREYKVKRDKPPPGLPDEAWWPAHRVFKATAARPPTPRSTTPEDAT